MTSGLLHTLRTKAPLRLENGQSLPQVTIGYQTYGSLNAEKSNAILICHALTGDQYCSGTSPITGKDGWWWRLIGDGKPLDTGRFFIICCNVLGGCAGTTGPKETSPTTGKPYALDFPAITIGDMVDVQAALLDELNIERLLAVIGPSMGGMQALQWAVRYPQRLQACVAIASSWRFTAQNIAFHEIGRQSIMADPNWHGGRYYEHGVIPDNGLAIARMAAHVTYMSEEALHQKFGRNLQDGGTSGDTFSADFQIQSYLRHQGFTFVKRFDANSYLYITRACDYFDLAEAHGGVLSKAFSSQPRYCIMAQSSDWMFPVSESRAIVRALNARAANVSYVELKTDKGHDAFLHDLPEFHRIMAGFMDSCASQARVCS